MIKNPKGMARKMPVQIDGAKDFLNVNLEQDPKIGFNPSIVKKEGKKKGGKK
ncbi:MAG TPA: hypothetical protein PKV92_08530 [Thermodesulfovibrio thiophilus]|nr:hypothetical protein [Thermodesulfovibrio thiophilus]HQD37124.1 hypothetical protein [Thermodesulfovibrio thiophilus]